MNLAAVIAESDRLFNQGDHTAVGEHLRRALESAVKSGDRQSELSILNELMGHYRMSNDRERGLSAVFDAIELIRELGIADSVSAGTIFINAATALHAFGEYEKAQEYYSCAYRSYTLNLAPDDRKFAGLFNNMAAVYLSQKDFELAKAYYLEALAVLKEYGEMMDIAVTYVNLAQCVYIADPLDLEADAYLNMAMNCFDAPLCVRDGYYAHTCIKCAGAFGVLGRKDLEKELNSRAKEIYEGH